jgi:hypothetical protein
MSGFTLDIFMLAKNCCMHESDKTNKILDHIIDLCHNEIITFCLRKGTKRLGPGLFWKVGLYKNLVILVRLLKSNRDGMRIFVLVVWFLIASGDGTVLQIDSGLVGFMNTNSVSDTHCILNLQNSTVYQLWSNLSSDRHR